MTPQLCLGTVQFGLPYGVTNKKGKVAQKEVSRLLHIASKAGITLIDTAQGYGTSEEVLGKCWPREREKRLISKLPARTPQQHWETNLKRSLELLNAKKLDSFLLHRPKDLLEKNGGELLSWLQSVQERGLVERIGVSIYEASELEALPLEQLQLVQLPLSVYDQRMIKNGTIERLQSRGIAIHVRSIFLQGLILQPRDSWPIYISENFKAQHHKWQRQLSQENITPLAGALAFAQGCPGIEAVLLGVLSTIATSTERMETSDDNKLEIFRTMGLER